MTRPPSFASALPLGHLIHDVARLMKRRFEVEAREHGITLPQWRALAEIAFNDGMTQVSLANCIDTDPMTLSGILDRLEKRGLIERTADPNDSRAKLATATAAGQALVDEVRTVGRTLYAQAIDGLTADERRQLQHALERMRDNLTAISAEQKELQE